jgi:hypothetical protein
MPNRTRLLPSQERLRELLDYRPEIGMFFWRESRGSVAIGQPAGFMGDWCEEIRIDGHNYKKHRVAWKWTTGEEPPDNLRHRSRDRRDNRWANIWPQPGKRTAT